MPANILLLGAGRVGAAMARDLAGDDGTHLAVADASSEALSALEGLPDTTLVHTDATDDDELDLLLSGRDLVVNALPGGVGFRTLRRLVDAGRRVVDISFFPEDPHELEDAARRNGAVVVVDAGVAPGLSNLLLGRLHAELDRVDSFSCLVGGLPTEPVGPYGYRATFSPADVIAEYVRPARVRRGGELVELDALTELEEVDVPGVGRLEAFLTDGLRTLLRSFPDVPDMVEKTLRWPGHATAMRALRDAGFFRRDWIDVEDTRVRPLDLAVRLLGEAWRWQGGERDVTVLRVRVRGERDGRGVHALYTLLDRHDEATGTSSMARTTGYTCTAVARILRDGRWSRPGIAAPERLGADESLFRYVLHELAVRGVTLEVETGED